MARRDGPERDRDAKAFFDFRQGIITDASRLMAPEGALHKCSNFDLQLNGAAYKRLGLRTLFTEYDVLSDETPRLPDVVGDVFSAKVWRPAPGVGILCILVGSSDVRPETDLNIHFYKYDGRPFVDSYITDMPVDVEVGGDFATNPVLITAQTFLIAGRNVFEYDEDEVIEADRINKSLIKVRIRDLEGFDEDDSPDPDDQDADGWDDQEIPWRHLYNLNNQGWPFRDVPIVATGAEERDPVDGNAIAEFYGKYNHFPRNYDLYQQGLLNRAWSADAVRAKGATGQLEPPKGRRIIDPEEPVRDVDVEIQGWPGTQSPFARKASEEAVGEGSLTPMAKFEGRIWYSGGRSNRIYYSQVVEGRDSIGKCYSHNDPTSGTEGQPLPTDGGYIELAMDGQVQAMRDFSNHLLVFTEQETWAITSAEGGMRPERIIVYKITNEGIQSPYSAVVAAGACYYVSPAGIMRISANTDEASGRMMAQNLSLGKINNHLAKIPTASRKRMLGTYNQTDQRIFWLYNTDEEALLRAADSRPTNKESARNKALIFDILTEAFFEYTLPVVDAEEEDEVEASIVGRVPVPGEIFSKENVQVVVGDADVMVQAQNVMALLGSTRIDDVTEGWVVFYRTEHDFGERTYLDLATTTDQSMLDLVGLVSVDGFDGAPYEAQLETQDDTAENPMGDKRYELLWTWFNITETGFDGTEFQNPSECSATVKYEWATSPEDGMWTDLGEVYVLPNGYVRQDNTVMDSFDVTTYRTTVPGHGRAVRIRFSSEPGKKCELLGWATQYSVGRG